MKVPEKYRMKHGYMPSDSSFGNNGAFEIPLSGRTTAIVIASDGAGWEHVSVTIKTEVRTPTWAEMCKVKDLFWDEEEVVVQYHPPKSMYIDNHKHCLHLWRPTDVPMPMPDPIMVGLKLNDLTNGE